MYPIGQMPTGESGGEAAAAPSPQTKEKQIFRKAIKAEDLPTATKPRITKQAALEKLTQTETQELQKKNGEIWDCVSRRPCKAGGYIYRFRVKDEYDFSNPTSPDQIDSDKLLALLTKTNEIFPANEPAINGVAEILHWDVTNNRPTSEIGDFLHKLGYTFERTNEGAFLTLPDRQALLGQWEKLKKSRDLPSLDIISSEGIAGDTEFIESYITHDSLLSSGREFMHDSIFHVIPVIKLKLSSHQSDATRYQHEKFKVVRSLASAYKRILTVDRALKEHRFYIPQEERERLSTNLEKFLGSLSAILDRLSAEESYEGVKEMHSFLQRAPTDFYLSNQDLYALHRVKRFGKDPFNFDELSQLWEKMGRMKKRERVVEPPPVQPPEMPPVSEQPVSKKRKIQ